MTNRKNRFNLFKTDKLKLKLGNSGEKEDDKSDSQTKNEKEDSSHFPSFDAIIPESSPLKNNSNANSCCQWLLCLFGLDSGNAPVVLQGSPEKRLPPAVLSGDPGSRGSGIFPVGMVP